MAYNPIILWISAGLVVVGLVVAGSAETPAITRWNALVKADPEIAAAAAQIEPYGKPAVKELATKYLALNDKQYLEKLVEQLVEKYNARTFSITRWNALVEVDPEIAAAAAQLAPYGKPAVKELATKFLALNDKQHLEELAKQLVEKYNAQMMDRDVQFVWRTPWGVIARMHDGGALVSRNGSVQAVPSYDKFCTQHPELSEGWVEIRDIDERQTFYTLVASWREGSEKKP